MAGPTSTSRWLFLGFMLAFAIKAPLFPFHGWLPDTYREAPPEVTAVLSGVIAKAGLYGMLRIAIPIFSGPDGPASFYRTAILALAAITLVYGSLLAFRAPDFRGVVAYSSLAQSGLIALGLFAGRASASSGAVLQMVAHGLISVSLFLVAGVDRAADDDRRVPAARRDGARTAGARDAAHGARRDLARRARLGELRRRVPHPRGRLPARWWWAVIGAGAIVLAAMYMLRLISAVLHEARGSTVSDEAMDVRPGELALVAPLVAGLLLLSAWPAADLSHHSARQPTHPPQAPASTVAAPKR